MRRSLTILAAMLAVMLALTPAAGARAHHHARKPACAAGRHAERVTVRRHVHVRLRHHGRLVRRHGHVVMVRRTRRVRVWRCERVKAPTPASPVTTPTSAPASTPPAVKLAVHLDPSFTQDVSDPLNVVYSYSADATSTSSTGQVTDLATTGQLPLGILQLYTQWAPGSGQQLMCSINVGGSTTGGTCPVGYQQTGAFQVTTVYITSSTTSATQTETETIVPYSTTTTETVTRSGPCSVTPTQTSGVSTYSCPYQLTASTIDDHGNAVTAPDTTTFVLSDGHGTVVKLPSGDGSCGIDVIETVPVGEQTTGGTGAFSGSRIEPTGGCSSDGGVDRADPSWSVSASYVGSPGWTGSTSDPQTVTAYQTAP